jgi:hypothetical protein
MTSKTRVIRLVISPKKLSKRLPFNFVEHRPVSSVEAGFADVPFDIPIDFNGEIFMCIQGRLSYDGESELLGTIEAIPEGTSEEQAELAFINFFKVN